MPRPHRIRPGKSGFAQPDYATWHTRIAQGPRGSLRSASSRKVIVTDPSLCRATAEAALPPNGLTTNAARATAPAATTASAIRSLAVFGGRRLAEPGSARRER